MEMSCKNASQLLPQSPLLMKVPDCVLEIYERQDWNSMYAVCSPASQGSIHLQVDRFRDEWYICILSPAQMDGPSLELHIVDLLSEISSTSVWPRKKAPATMILALVNRNPARCGPH